MATAKVIQEYLLEHGEGWERNATHVLKTDLPICGEAYMFAELGFDTRNDWADDSVVFYIAQEDIDNLTLTQAIQLINEKTGDNIPLPKERNNMEERFHNKNLYLIAFISIGMLVLWLVLG